MDIIVEYGEQIVQWLASISALIVSITMFVKALKSENRVTDAFNIFKKSVATDVSTLDSKIAITRAGIVQGFKEAVVTKDVKVSVNSQVKKIIDEKMQEFLAIIKKGEESRTKLTYWTLKILRYTAASDKLTTEQQSEVDEVMALIAEDETIIDTIN